MSMRGVAGAASLKLFVATAAIDRITQDEMDRKVLQSVNSTQLYDLRMNALDTLINDHLLQQAKCETPMNTIRIKIYSGSSSPSPVMIAQSNRTTARRMSTNSTSTVSLGAIGKRSLSRALADYSEISPKTPLLTLFCP
jgi:hypothetical protein